MKDVTKSPSTQALATCRSCLLPNVVKEGREVNSSKGLLVAYWLKHSTVDQKIQGSSPTI